MSKKEKKITTFIKDLCKDAGLKQYEFAEKIGMCHMYVNNQINDPKKLNPEFYTKISKEFDVTVKQLIDIYYEDNK